MTKIIHFSDSHAGGGAEDYLAYFDKRWVGVFNYKFRRQFQHEQNNLSLAIEYILDTKPDVVVCTGDLTSTGQPGEFATAKDILRPLRESNIPILYTPGNHDYYVKRSKCVNAMKEMTEYLTKGKYSFDDMPCVQQYGGIDFIIVNESWPTNLLMSSGSVKKRTSQFVEQFCNKPKQHPRIIIGHYPLIEEAPIMRFRHRLFGQKNVLKLLRNGMIDISLCGHIHHPYCKLTTDGKGEICAGSITRNGVINEICYDEKTGLFKQQHLYLNDF